MEVLITNKSKPLGHYNGYTCRDIIRKEGGQLFDTFRRKGLQDVVKCLRQKWQSFGYDRLFMLSPGHSPLLVVKKTRLVGYQSSEGNASNLRMYTEELAELRNKGYDFFTEMLHQLTTMRLF